MLKAVALGAVLALTASGAFACDTVASKVVPISFCVESAIWTPDKATPPQEFVYYDKEQNTGFAVVTELGNANEADYRTAILNNAGGGAAKLMGERTEIIGGENWHVIEYSSSVSGTTLDYQNFYLVNPGVGGIQMVFFSTEADLTKAAVRAGMILGSVKFTN
jgi:hypothetical protein